MHSTGQIVCTDCQGKGYCVGKPMIAKDQIRLRFNMIGIGSALIGAAYWAGTDISGTYTWWFIGAILFGGMLVLCGLFPIILAALGFNIKTGRVICINCDGTGKVPV